MVQHDLPSIKSVQPLNDISKVENQNIFPSKVCAYNKSSYKTGDDLIGKSVEKIPVCLPSNKDKEKIFLSAEGTAKDF